MYDETQEEWIWARGLNPNPVRDSIRAAGRRLLGRIPAFTGPVIDDDIAMKRKRLERAKQGIITVGGM